METFITDILSQLFGFYSVIFVIALSLSAVLWILLVVLLIYGIKALIKYLNGKGDTKS